MDRVPKPATLLHHIQILFALFRKPETVLSNAAIIDLQWSAENPGRDEQ